MSLFRRMVWAIFIVDLLAGVPVITLHSLLIDYVTAVSPPEPEAVRGQIYEWFNHKQLYVTLNQYLVLESTKIIMWCFIPVAMVCGAFLSKR